MFAWLLGFPYVMRFLGLNPTPRKPPALPPAAAAPDDIRPKKEELKPADAVPKEDAKPAVAKGQGPAKGGAEAAPEGAPKRPEVEVVDESKLVLGSATDRSPTGYRLEAQLQQKGAGLESLSSSRFDAEFENGLALKRPLQLVKRNVTVPPSLAVTLSAGDGGVVPAVPEDDARLQLAAREGEDWLDSVLWEVVPDEQGHIKRPVSMIDPATRTPVEGESIVFRTKAASGVVVTKTFRLGKNIDGLEVELKFESPDRERKLVYNLLGPHGIPVEGEWYTGTFRDLFFAQLNGSSTSLNTCSAYDVAKGTDKTFDNTSLPLRFTGVENQYFATLFEPDPAPTGQQDRWDSKAVAVVLHKDPEALQKSDVGVRMTSRPITVGPGQTVVHTYRVFAGPKTTEALRPYGADELASYRKSSFFLFTPFTATATYLARFVITPTLGFAYDLTARVAQLFGGTSGNYGVAIILLTVLVRALMFPLGRKQALIAQKMQELQPYLKEIQEKYKDDKERLTKEQFALYKKHGVNPVGGCLPALIQLPIFMGLWQALNTSVPLRHAPFLWIRDLAAPDMMFRFPFDVPFLGYWFNLLPFLVVGLMLLQTKLFSPPPTTPDAEMQQKMMKYMMIFMGVMFYKVPSGLGIYFITSSLWAIGERLLLPKVIHTHPHAATDAPDGEVGAEKGTGPRGGGKAVAMGSRPGVLGGGKGAATGNGASGPAKPPGRFATFWEKILEEARKDPTYRRVIEEREGKGRDKEKGDPRARPRRR
jgi:YidC/Oxa1 family membrane protein insertase